MSDNTEHMCADCPHFISSGTDEDGLAIGLGVCGIDGEMVYADDPQCSNAPLSHGWTRCGEIGGENEHHTTD